MPSCTASVANSIVARAVRQARQAARVVKERVRKAVGESSPFPVPEGDDQYVAQKLASFKTLEPGPRGRFPSLTALVGGQGVTSTEEAVG